MVSAATEWIMSEGTDDRRCTHGGHVPHDTPPTNVNNETRGGGLPDARRIDASGGQRLHDSSLRRKLPQSKLGVGVEVPTQRSCIVHSTRVLQQTVTRTSRQRRSGVAQHCRLSPC